MVLFIGDLGRRVNSKAEDFLTLATETVTTESGLMGNSTAKE